MKTISQLMVLLIGLFTAHAAQADILFIDLNLSSVEVAAARAAAEQRGEKLIVIPDLSSALRKEFQNIMLPLRAKSAQIDVLAAERAAILNQAEKGSKVEKEKAEKAAAEISKRIEKKYAEAKKFNDAGLAFLSKNNDLLKIDLKASIDRVLAEVQKDHKKLSSIVLSAHHVASFFGFVGKGELSAENITDALNKYPEVRDQIRSLYLWGCYTNTIDELKKWKTALPKLALIAGFEKSAPSEDKQIDEAFLKGILIKEKGASENMDAKKAVALFNSIANVKTSNAALYCGDSYVTNHGVTQVATIVCKDSEVKKLKADAEEFQKYLKAETKGYEDVPASTQTSKLRSLYSQVRQMSHCPELQELALENGRMLRLIFFKNITKNFNDFFKVDIEHFNSLLKNANSPGGFFPDLSDPKLTRADLLTKLRGFSQYWAQPQVAGTLSFVRASELNGAADAILNHLNCIGSFWIEHPESRERLTADYDSSCAEQALGLQR